MGLHMAEGKAITCFNLLQLGALLADCRWDFIDKIDVCRRPDCQAVDERWNGTRDVDIDPVMDVAAKQVQDLPDLDRGVALHQTPPDMREALWAQLLSQNLLDPRAHRILSEPFGKPGFIPKPPQGANRITHQ